MTAKANALSSRSRSKWPELVQEATDWIIHAFMAKGMDKDEAESIALTAVDAFTEKVGGQMIYIPRAQLARSDERNRCICDEFTGSNHSELARKWSTSVQNIYRVVKKTGNAP